MDPLRESLLIDLVSAAWQGDLDRVRLLLAHGIPADIEAMIPGVGPHAAVSALHAAVLRGDVEILAALLERCGSPDRPRLGGATPLAYVVHELSELGPAPTGEAAVRGAALLKALSLLLEAGADPQCGAADQTPLQLARMYRLDGVEALLMRGGSSTRPN